MPNFYYTKFLPFADKFKVLALVARAIITNNTVDIDKHPSGSYQVWIDTHPFEGDEE